MPLISIIVPAFNEEKSIEKTLKSLRNQTYEDYELIVINNNSTDNTEKIAKKYTNKVFLEKKRGYHNAVNRGAVTAKGNIITFCDADTLYPPAWIENIIQAFNNPKIVAVYGGIDFESQNLLLKNIGVPVLNFLNLTSKNVFDFDITCGFNFAFKKDVYFKVGGYNPDIFNQTGLDFELGRRIKNEGIIHFIPNTKVKTSYRRAENIGALKWFMLSIKTWYYLLRNKAPTMSYNEYNIEYR